jgi:hypothetical protein
VIPREGVESYLLGHEAGINISERDPVIPREGVERWAAKLREALTFMSV